MQISSNSTSKGSVRRRDTFVAIPFVSFVLDSQIDCPQIHRRMQFESYAPSTWRTHPVHLVPPTPYDPAHPGTKATLDWIFFISSMNFSFWSEREDTFGRYAVAWKKGWADEFSNTNVLYTGYWSLVASVNRGPHPRHCYLAHSSHTIIHSSGNRHTDHGSHILCKQRTLSRLSH